jgi:hypothetical protein
MKTDSLLMMALSADFSIMDDPVQCSKPHLNVAQFQLKTGAGAAAAGPFLNTD